MHFKIYIISDWNRTIEKSQISFLAESNNNTGRNKIKTGKIISGIEKHDFQILKLRLNERDNVTVENWISSQGDQVKI